MSDSPVQPSYTSFEAPPCPRCGHGVYGEVERVESFFTNTTFENHVITCNRCWRRSSECAAIVSEPRDPRSRASFDIEAIRAEVRDETIESWLGSRPGDD